MQYLQRFVVFSIAYLLCVATPLFAASLPSVHLPVLNQPGQTFSNQSFAGQVVLVNVWASWCGACRKEHPMMMEIQEKYHVPIYGILYHDDSESASEWLQRTGNPYVLIGDDYNGEAASALKIYGTPETFVLNKQGEIIYQQVGVISEYTWRHMIYPLIQKARQSF